MKLDNVQHEQFANEYLIDFNGTQAAIRAGYSPNSANEQACAMLAKPHIWSRVVELIEERKIRTKITADYVLSIINETIDRCRQVEAVKDKRGAQVMVKTITGEMVPAFIYDAKAVLKGCELLGRHLQMFSDRHILVNEKGFTPEEIANMIPSKASRAYHEITKDL